MHKQPKNFHLAFFFWKQEKSDRIIAKMKKLPWRPESLQRGRRVLGGAFSEIPVAHCRSAQTPLMIVSKPPPLHFGRLLRNQAILKILKSMIINDQSMSIKASTCIITATVTIHSLPGTFTCDKRKRVHEVVQPRLVSNPRGVCVSVCLSTGSQLQDLQRRRPLARRFKPP